MAIDFPNSPVVGDTYTVGTRTWVYTSTGWTAYASSGAPTGLSLGAWASWTPTISGTGWAQGNGTVTAAYTQMGKTVHYRIRFVAGTTTTFGSAALEISLPVAAISVAGVTGHSSGYLLDSSASARYGVFCIAQSSGTLIVYANSSVNAGQQSALISTVPFTWASSDSVNISGTYEAA